MVSSALNVRIAVTDLDRGQLEQLFDLLGEKLMERQGPESSLLDHSVSIDLGTGVIEITVTTSAKSEREAQVLADYYVNDVLTSSGGVYSAAAEEQHQKDAFPPEFGIEVTAHELVPV